jgi:hypothetical protein
LAKERQANEEDESGEFADFLADVSQEIAQRVESLDPKVAPVAAEAKKTPPTAEARKTPTTADAGVITEWPSIVERMIEEMR